MEIKEKSFNDFFSNFTDLNKVIGGHPMDDYFNFFAKSTELLIKKENLALKEVDIIEFSFTKRMNSLFGMEINAIYSFKKESYDDINYLFKPSELSITPRKGSGKIVFDFAANPELLLMRC